MSEPEEPEIELGGGSSGRDTKPSEFELHQNPLTRTGFIEWRQQEDGRWYPYITQKALDYNKALRAGLVSRVPDDDE